MQLLVVDAIEVITHQYIPLKEQINQFVTVLFIVYKENGRVKENEL